MAYEVTKRIKGHDYRYLVETRVDPQTRRRKAKWTYVGPANGNGNGEVVARRARRHVTKDDIVAAAAKLLETRDAEHVTVSVIAAAAGASRSTFYRFFDNQETVLNAALLAICDHVIRDHPKLDGDVRTVEAARSTFHAWAQAHYGSIAKTRALRRALAQGEHGKVRMHFERSQLERDPWTELEAFFRAIDAAGLSTIPDPAAMSRAILGSMIAVKYTPFLALSSQDLNLPNWDDLYAMLDRAVFH